MLFLKTNFVKQFQAIHFTSSLEELLLCNLIIFSKNCNAHSNYIAFVFQIEENATE